MVGDGESSGKLGAKLANRASTCPTSLFWGKSDVGEAEPTPAVPSYLHASPDLKGLQVPRKMSAPYS